MHTKRASMMTDSCLPWLASLLLSGVSLTAFAAPWSMQQMLSPPAEAGYSGEEKIGFGHELALRGRWLAIGTYFGHCAEPIGVSATGSVLMYRYSPTTFAVQARRMAIGAPHYNALNTGLGTGYVVIYGR